MSKTYDVAGQLTLIPACEDCMHQGVETQATLWVESAHAGLLLLCASHAVIFVMEERRPGEELRAIVNGRLTDVVETPTVTRAERLARIRHNLQRAGLVQAAPIA